MKRDCFFESFVSDIQITTTYGIISAKLLTQWGSQGKSKTNISTGACSKFILRPGGLFGFC
ncbi:hypothetical protein [Prochlorococcus marinus]|uniref:hypothetical protein n=1 Tax=Prochlorococcus marinus TaxID=1219 RepID=UPI0022B2D328|nr:hypothetical protein [Prochlorococcus marinus]